MKISQLLPARILILLLLCSFSQIVRSQTSKEPKLIRDTEVAEGKEEAEKQAVKEPNPKLAKQYINIGNYYLKQQNYAAAIQRFAEAIEYDKDEFKAYEGLIRAYEKSGELLKAIDTCKGFLEKNPESSKASEIRDKLAKLEKKSS